MIGMILMRNSINELSHRETQQQFFFVAFLFSGMRREQCTAMENETCRRGTVAIAFFQSFFFISFIVLRPASSPERDRSRESKKQGGGAQRRHYQLAVATFA